MVSLDFLLTSLVVVLIPGPGVLFSVSTGIAQGRRAAVFAALGCTAGIVPHLLATAAGLAALLHTSALAFQALKWAGAAYLLYLAWATWRDRTGFAVADGAPRAGMGRVAVTAFAMNILNPKLSIFFLAFLPQFVKPEAASPLLQLLGLSSLFMAMTFVVFVAYGMLAHGFRSVVMRSPAVQGWMRRGFSAAFAALGLRLALADR